MVLLIHVTIKLIIVLFCFNFLAVADGALQPIISLCGMKEHIALLAVMTLSLIVEHHANLSALVEVFTYISTDMS